MSKKNNWNPLHVSEKINEEISAQQIAKASLVRAPSSFSTSYTVSEITRDNNFIVKGTDNQAYKISLAGIKLKDAYDHVNNKETSTSTAIKNTLNSYIGQKIYIEEYKGQWYVWDQNGNMIQENLLSKNAAYIDNSSMNSAYIKGLQIAANSSDNLIKSDFKSFWNSLTENSSSNGNASYPEDCFHVRPIQQTSGQDDPLGANAEIFSKNDYYDAVAYALLYKYQGNAEYLDSTDNQKGLNELASNLSTDNFTENELKKIKQKIAISLLQIQLEQMDKDGTKNNNLEQIQKSRNYLLLKALKDTYSEEQKYENYDYLNLGLRQITYTEYDSSGKAIEHKEKALTLFNELLESDCPESIICSFIKNGLPSSDLPGDVNLVGIGVGNSSTASYSLNSLLKEGVMNDLQNYLQFNAANMIEFDLVSNKYYSSINAYIFFNGVKVDEITSINWTVDETNQPIYSYASYTYDALLKGARIVTGSFTINFTKSSYLKSVLDKVNESKVTDSTGTEVVNNIERIINGANTDSLNDGGKAAAVRKMIEDGNETNIQAIAKTYEDKLWGRNATDVINRYNQPLYDYKPFDIVIPWGDNMFNLANITSTDKEGLTIINQVSIIGESQNITIGPDNIQQKFSFVAKDINNSLITEQQEYKANQ